MRIIEIVLEGFKSYASRTVISGFDEHFNAITGLNGSGKSNILDAICFVLGISTLSLVRVANKQELIYKNGQAGVTKANVTLLFDNSDKARCHEAYRKYDQISVRREYSVGGVSKCTINGTNVTNEKLLQLFSLSGLNVNNANFLIMQGRITQVINMKPSEILSLVEETAGTNAYEEIKKKTLKLLEKKDGKLVEIDSILNNEVLPIMQQLEKENEDYLKWKSLCIEIENLEKKIKAASYYELRDMLVNSEEIQKNYNEVIKDLDKKEKHLVNQIKELEKQQNEIKEKEAKLIPEKDKKTIDTLKQKKEALEAQINRKKSEQASWEAKKAESFKEMEKEKQFNTRKAGMLNRAHEEITKFKEESEELKKTLENLKNKLQAIERGAEVNENFTEERINELIRKRENILQELKTKETMIVSYKKKLVSRRNELSLAKTTENFDFSEINRQIADLEARIAKSKTFSDSEYVALESDKRQYEDELTSISKNLERIDQGKYSLTYSLPESNFDRNKIKGKMIRLINLKQEKYARALESGAGGRLYSIVVDTDVTGQVLLQRKTFGNVSILPNNKTIPTVIPFEIKQAAEKAFGNKAKVALDIIDYDQENYNSVGFVFGNFFVCENKEIAEKIAYDSRFRKVAVTIEGDVYNPNGTMSGGEANNKPSSLAEYHRYQDQEKNMQKVQKKLSETVKKMDEIGRQKDLMMALQNDLDIKKIQKSNKEKTLQESSSARLTGEIEEIEQNIEINETAVADLKKQDNSLEKEITTLKRQSESNPKDVLTKTITKIESELKKNHEKVRKTQGHINELEEEIGSTINSIQELTEKIQQLSTKLEANNQEIYENTETIAELNLELQQLKVNYDKKLHELLRQKDLAVEISEHLEKYSKEFEDLKKEQHNLDSKRKLLQKDTDQALKSLEELESKHPYIPSMESEIQNFDKNCAVEQIENMQTERDRQSKRINKKVSSTLDDHQKRCASLTSKRSIVLQDKQKLQEIISGLDKKKQECIEET